MRASLREEDLDLRLAVALFVHGRISAASVRPKNSFWKLRKASRGLVWPLVLIAVLPGPADAYPRPGITERVSLGVGGTSADGASSFPSISADGR